MASGPAAELAERCCRRWPAADALAALLSVPAQSRGNWRDPLLTQLLEELQKRCHQR